MTVLSFRRGAHAALAALSISGLTIDGRSRGEDLYQAAKTKTAASLLESGGKPSDRPEENRAGLQALARAVSTSDCRFTSGASSIKIHVSISNKIHQGRSVDISEIKELFDALTTEKGNQVSEQFYSSYADLFGGDQAKQVIIEHLEQARLYPDLLGRLKAGAATSTPLGETSAIPPETLTSFSAIDRSPVPVEAVSFEINSKAATIHRSISRDITDGRPVPTASLKALFTALSEEQVANLGPAFFLGYAKKFENADAVRLMIKSLIPVRNGDSFLPQGWAATPLVMAIRDLATAFPPGTSVEYRRDLFESLHQTPNLNVRALSLMLCITSNIEPHTAYSPAEIVRASQQLSRTNRLRGDEFRLGILLRDRLNQSSVFGIDTAILNRIKMPLLRRAQMIERRNPGITEALLSVSDDAYVAFLREHAHHIIAARDEIADQLFLAPGDEFSIVLNASSQYSAVTGNFVAHLFGLTFYKKRDVIKAEDKSDSTVAKDRYLALLRNLSKPTATNRRRLVWLQAHGNPDALAFRGGEAGQQIGNSSRQTPAHEYITPKEEANALMGERDFEGVWFLDDPCEAFNRGEEIANRLIGSYLKKMPLEQVVANCRIPGRVTCQSNMLSPGEFFPIPTSTWPFIDGRRRKAIMGSGMLALISAAQNATHGEPAIIWDGRGIRVHLRDEPCPYSASFRHLYEADALLSGIKEEKYRAVWTKSEGVPLEFLKNTQGTDLSVQSGKLFNPDSLNRDIVDRLRKDGFAVPDPQSLTPPEKRPFDLVLELN